MKSSQPNDQPSLKTSSSLESSSSTHEEMVSLLLTPEEAEYVLSSIALTLAQMSADLSMTVAAMDSAEQTRETLGPRRFGKLIEKFGNLTIVLTERREAMKSTHAPYTPDPRD